MSIYLRTSLDYQINVSQYWLFVTTIPHTEIFKLDFALTWPVAGQLYRGTRLMSHFFLLKLCELEYSLNTRHLRDRLSRLSDTSLLHTAQHKDL